MDDTGKWDELGIPRRWSFSSSSFEQRVGSSLYYPQQCIPRLFVRRQYHGTFQTVEKFPGNSTRTRPSESSSHCPIQYTAHLPARLFVPHDKAWLKSAPYIRHLFTCLVAPPPTIYVGGNSRGPRVSRVSIQESARLNEPIPLQSRYTRQRMNLMLRARRRGATRQALHGLLSSMPPLRLWFDPSSIRRTVEPYVTDRL